MEQYRFLKSGGICSQVCHCLLYNGALKPCFGFEVWKLLSCTGVSSFQFFLFFFFFESADLNPLKYLHHLCAIVFLVAGLGQSQVHFFIYTGGLLEGSNFFLGGSPVARSDGHTSVPPKLKLLCANSEMQYLLKEFTISKRY